MSRKATATEETRRNERAIEHARGDRWLAWLDHCKDDKAIAVFDTHTFIAFAAGYDAGKTAVADAAKPRV